MANSIRLPRVGYPLMQTDIFEPRITAKYPDLFRSVIVSESLNAENHQCRSQAHVALGQCIPTKAEQYLQRVLTDFDTRSKIKTRCTAKAQFSVQKREWDKAEKDPHSARRKTGIRQKVYLEYQCYYRGALALFDEITAAPRDRNLANRSVVHA